MTAPTREEVLAWLTWSHRSRRYDPENAMEIMTTWEVNVRAMLARGIEDVHAACAQEALRILTAPADRVWRADPGHDGIGDEFVATGAIHLERMSDGHVWCNLAGVRFDIVAGKRGRLTWRPQESSWDRIPVSPRADPLTPPSLDATPPAPPSSPQPPARS